jgi:hypothetical protein
MATLGDSRYLGGWCPEENVTRRRHALLVDVTQAASEVSRLVHEARDLHLPVEPGVREGRDA